MTMWNRLRRDLPAVGVAVLVGLSVTSPASLSAARRPRLTEAQYVTLMNDALEKVRGKLEPLPTNPIKFSGNLFFAHGAVVKNISTETLIAYVDALKEAGVQRVDINPGVFPFLRGDAANVAKYDRMVQRIRDARLELVINPEPNRGEVKVSSMADWTEQCVALYGDLARRYHPEIFVLIHEPTTMAARMNLRTSPADWRKFIQRTAAAVKKESPGSRLAAGGLAHEMPYFRQFVNMREVQTLTVNIYDIGALHQYNAMIAMALRAGKPIYIGETWRPPFTSGDSENLEALMTTSLGDEKFQDLDVKWLDVMARYASVMKMEAITAFWTTSFFAYVPNSRGALDPEYNRKVIEAIGKGQRTSTFREFQKMVKRYR